MLSGLAVRDVGGGLEGFDFGFSKGALRPNEIFDSATSPPARYVVELARRISAAAPSADFLLIGNPLLPLSTKILASWLQGPVQGPLLLSDRDGFPLLYGLPSRFVADHERFLLTLSAVDATLDHRLLEGLLGAPITLQKHPKLAIGTYPLSTATGWFQGSERQKLLKIATANAIKIVERRPDWRQVASTVYHPYHAGSIVFFAMAARDVATPLFSRQVICSSYKDICAASDSPLTPIWLKLPFLPRDGSVGEPQYFAHALDRLGERVMEDNFLVFMRYSRNSAVSPFHMIDHDRFSLGESLATQSDLRQLRPPLVQNQCRLPTEPLRILFHVTGGLPIKNYPVERCKVVLRTLAALGIECSVIGRPDLEEWGAGSIEADETDLLAEAVTRHHLFVGLDSFPHHFVKNVLGWPSIGLFGTTGAGNFGGGWNSHYRALDCALACHPCGAEQTCPVFTGPECRNYAKPEELIGAILDMARQIYGYSS